MSTSPSQRGFRTHLRASCRPQRRGPHAWHAVILIAAVCASFGAYAPLAKADGGRGGRHSGHDRIAMQREKVARAKVRVDEARIARTTAAIEVKEYEDGVFVQKKAAIDDKLQLAQVNLKTAESKLAYSKKLHDKGFITPLALEADEFAATKSKKELRVAEMELKTLLEFTKKKALEELNGKLAIAATRLQAAETALAAEEAKLSALENPGTNANVDAGATRANGALPRPHARPRRQHRVFRRGCCR